jgi:3-oxoacyl-(acyl-carrier-protein) synthase
LGTFLFTVWTPTFPLSKLFCSHLEGASGVLAVVKTIMMLQRGRVLPNANFERLNDKIEGKEKLRASDEILTLSL